MFPEHLPAILLDEAILITVGMKGQECSLRVGKDIFHRNFMSVGSESHFMGEETKAQGVQGVQLASLGCKLGLCGS